LKLEGYEVEEHLAGGCGLSLGLSLGLSFRQRYDWIQLPRVNMGIVNVADVVEQKAPMLLGATLSEPRRGSPRIDDMVKRTILYVPMPSVARKKTYNLDEELIGRARRVLEARTDTETIQRALRKVVEDAQIENALGAVLAEGRFRTVFR